MCHIGVHLNKNIQEIFLLLIFYQMKNKRLIVFLNLGKQVI